MAGSSKKKTGFFLPGEVVDAFEEVAERVGGKEKWQVISAAILLFYEAAEQAQNDTIKRIRDAAGPGGSFSRLIAEARAKKKTRGRNPGGKQPGGIVRGDYSGVDLVERK